MPVAKAVLPSLPSRLRTLGTVLLSLGLAGLGLLTAAAISPSGQAAEAPAADKAPAKAADKFVRLVRDDRQQPVALETAIVRFAYQSGLWRGKTVDLVAAVHIGDKDYYQRLNRQFKDYDVVLYELVAPEGTRIPKGGRRGTDNPVSAIQKGLKGFLELEFQLDQIDYTRANFVHADLSPEKFAQSMQDRGESISGMLARMIGYAFARQGQTSGSEADLLLALFDKNRALKLKQVLAEQFEQMDWMLDAIDGPDGSTLISERNKAALAVLRKQLAAGKRKIAIFYGAAHMSDFEKRLATDFGIKPVETRWVQAWNLTGK
jgi:hypothetical protein